MNLDGRRPSSGPQAVPSWLEPWLAQNGLDSTASVERIFTAADTHSLHTAPNARLTWVWLLLFECAAVLAPVLWLLSDRGGPSVIGSASVVLAVCAVTVALCWWLRWKGTRHAWTRSRLIAEVMRSRLACAGVAPSATRRALAVAPSIRGLAGLGELGADSPGSSWRERRDEYLTGRVDDQLAYFEKQSGAAGRTRARLSRWVTRALDAALFLAVVGLVIALSTGVEIWLRLSESDVLLVLVGCGLPLVALFCQNLNGYLGLDRRRGRYLQQVEMLRMARQELVGARSEEEVRAIVERVEASLLSEVVEWYYVTENAESFYRKRTRQERAAMEASEPGGRRMGLLTRGHGLLVRGMGFFAQVLFGRVLIAVFAVVATTLLISYRLPAHAIQQSMLRVADGRLSSGLDRPWEPADPSRSGGLVVIAHGLHGGVGPDSWMLELKTAIEEEASGRTPDVVLVEWAKSAAPSRGGRGAVSSSVDSSTTVGRSAAWLDDIAQIRPQAEEIGKLVGLKLALEMKRGELSSDQPMHLIGHSAGGFVVLKIARILNDLELLPARFRVTMLDTPVPRQTELDAVLEFADVDYFRTSDFAQLVPPVDYHPRWHRSDVPLPAGTDPYLAAHEYAHEWYERSVRDHDSLDGFARSPLLR